MNFKESCQTRGIHFTLAAPEHLIINGQVKVTWRTLCTISHSLMVHARISEACIHFALMYTTDHIFPVLLIKDPINKDRDLTPPFKLATCTKPSVTHFRVFFCPYVVQKSTAHVGKKALNMSHQSQKGFRGIFVGILQHQKRISCVYIEYKEDNIFIWCCLW